MAVKQYIGARYVPKFASPIEWAADTSYEALTIVTFNNASYTSKVQVPPTVGNPAKNPQYWALTGNYNSQVEQYRQEVETSKTDLAGQMKQLKTDTEKAIQTETTNRENADTEINNIVKQVQEQANKITETAINIKPYYDAGVDLNTLIAENVTLFFPKGEYITDLLINAPHVKITGNNATIKGSITVDIPLVDNTQLAAFFTIENIQLTKNTNNYAIQLLKARQGTIQNIYIDKTFEYGIYQNDFATYGQPTDRTNITNCYIESAYGVYLNDNDKFCAGDITIANNYFVCDKSCLYCNHVDGFTFSDNTVFTDYRGNEAYNQIDLHYTNWATITNNTLFESSGSAIYVDHCQYGVISNNIVGYCGEAEISDAIYMNGYDFAGSQYDLCLYTITGNLIFRPTGNGIYCGLRSCHLSIQSNQVFEPGNRERYRGPEAQVETKYCVNYPLMNNWQNGTSYVYNNVGSSCNIFNNASIKRGGNNDSYIDNYYIQIPSQEFKPGQEYRFDMNVPNGQRAIAAAVTRTSVSQDVAYFIVSGFNSNSFFVKNNYTTALTTAVTVMITTVSKTNIRPE